MSQCPACGQPLVIYEIGVIEADVCVDCRGTWLDAGELEMIATQCGLGDDLLRRSLGETPQVRRGARRCPRCRWRMHVTRHAEGVELDRCPNGHGFWFDRGEIRNLLAAFTGRHDTPEAVRRLGELLRFELESTPREEPAP